MFEEGRYAEAQELWEKAIGLMEHPQAQYSELETVDEEQPSFETPESFVMSDETLETPPIVEKYQSGLSLLEQKEYGEAKRVFQEIDAMQPDYRNAKRYLTVIDELLREEDSPMEQELRSDEAQEQGVADREEYPEIVPDPKAQTPIWDLTRKKRRNGKRQWSKRNKNYKIRSRKVSSRSTKKRCNTINVKSMSKPEMVLNRRRFFPPTIN